MAHVGYIRVSSTGQNTARQLDQVMLDKTFTDTVSGDSRDRPALQACLEYLREGDTLHVHSIDRLARSLADLLHLVQRLTTQGVTVQFHGENLTFDGGNSPVQNLLFQVVGACAEFERAMIRERQREGLRKAKERGKHCGRPRTFSHEEQRHILERLRNGELASEIACEHNVTPSCIYKLRKRLEAGEVTGKVNDAEKTQKGRDRSASDDAV